MPPSEDGHTKDATEPGIRPAESTVDEIDSVPTPLGGVKSKSKDAVLG